MTCQEQVRPVWYPLGESNPRAFRLPGLSGPRLPFRQVGGQGDFNPLVACSAPVPYRPAQDWSPGTTRVTVRGGHGGSRTRYLRVANPALSLVSFMPEATDPACMGTGSVADPSKSPTLLGTPALHGGVGRPLSPVAVGSGGGGGESNTPSVAGEE